jgi:hypothetical protein
MDVDKMRMLVGGVAALTLAACGTGGSSSPSPSPTQRLYAVGQTVPGPDSVGLTVLETRIDPPGEFFPLTPTGRWINVRLAVRNQGQQPYARSALDLVMDILVRDQNGTNYAASARAEGDAALGAPVLPGQTSIGWMRFAVPAQGSLRLLWVSALAEVRLAT